MPFGGIVVNRLHTGPELNGGPPGELVEELGERLAGRVATSARELAALAERDAANVAHLRERLGDPPLLIVPERQDDVHDVEGLAHVRAHLWGERSATRVRQQERDEPVEVGRVDPARVVVRHHARRVAGGRRLVRRDDALLDVRRGHALQAGRQVRPENAVRVRRRERVAGAATLLAQTSRPLRTPAVSAAGAAGAVAASSPPPRRW